MFTKRRAVGGALLALAVLASIAVRAEARPSVYWTDQFGGANEDLASAVATTSNGDTIVYGTTSAALLPGYTVSGTTDLFLARYSRSGDRKWLVEFGSSGIDLSTRTIALASNGDIIVSGTLTAAYPGFTLSGSTDVFVARFNRNGRQLWLNEFGSSGVDLASATAVSPSGDIYLAVTSGGAFPNGSAPPTPTYGNTDAVLVKVDRKGVLKWSRSVGSSESDMGAAVAVSKRNDVYFVGSVYGSVDGNPWSGDEDAFIARYDKNGNQILLAQSGDVGADSFAAVATSSRGDVYAAGATQAASAGSVPGFKTLQGVEDGLVVKFTKQLDFVWSNDHGTVGDDQDWSIAVARNGQVVVGGLTDDAWPGYTNKGGADTYVAKLTSAGDAVTARQFGTAGDDGNSQFGAAVSLIGNSTVVLASSVDSASIWGHESAGSIDAFIGAFPTP